MEVKIRYKFFGVNIIKYGSEASTDKELWMVKNNYIEVDYCLYSYINTFATYIPIDYHTEENYGD